MTRRLKYSEDTIPNKLTILAIEVFFVLVAIISSPAFAASFGSTAKGSISYIEENQTAEFSLLFWSNDNATILINVINNGGLDVDMNKYSLQIGPMKGDEMIYTSDKYTHASVAKVYARSVAIGTYSIIVSAKMLSDTGQLSVTQERVFNLTVISGKKTPAAGTQRIIPEISFPQVDGSSLAYLIFMFMIILIVAYAIYRYS